MKPSIPIAQLNTMSPDAIRWFIIGAYQAGASESEIVSLTNLSRYTIRYTIASFVRTGLPNLRMQKQPTKIKKANRPTKHSYHYKESTSDTEDDLSDSSSDEEDRSDDIKKEDQDQDQLDWKQSLLLRRKGRSTATDTMAYVLYKGRKYEEKRVESWQKQDPFNRMMVRPPSPPEEDMILKSEPGEKSPVPCRRVWTQMDDKILLRHILTRTGHWDKLDQAFEGKHSVADCIERWDVLQHYLIKELKKTGTSSW